jgi:hypothetical protein
MIGGVTFQFEERCPDGQKCGATTTGCLVGQCQRFRPVAWLHKDHPTAHVITDKVKRLWLAVRPKHVENYTIPVYSGDNNGSA